jgi:ATP-dependent helicase HrpA
VSSALATFQARLAECLRADLPSLRRQLRSYERLVREGKPHSQLHRAIELAIQKSHDVRAARASHALSIAYPGDLPISAQRDAILSALRTHQVLVVSAATGSGKTTQVPKMLLEAGLGLDGTIAHTQPRRVAARSVATRIAHELGTEPGQAVGYQVRFESTASPRSRLIVLTDGVLLAQLREDPLLLRHDAVIVDEAHERSLNIDLLLGALRKILRQRPEFRVVISSATLDAARFASHFDGATVLQVEGRTHPVEIRHAVTPGGQDGDPVQAALEAVEGCLDEARGDGLVFFASEREIHDFVEAARGRFRGIEVLPLYSRLPSDQQDRIFSPGAARRIIACTNIAETSLTVPRIGWVVDSGLVRLSRYSPRSRLQRLPIEPISKASAAQRAGRAGRLFPGLCVRLFSEADHDLRPDFTVPEVQRANLSGVVLQLSALGLGAAEHFPWIDPPSLRLVREAQDTLVELGAFTSELRLTRLGRDLAQWPLDPRIARTIIAGHANTCLAEALILAARMAIQDPRDRPAGATASADLAHALLRDERSDAMSTLKLWRAWKAACAELGSSARRRWCTERFLSPMRMREWDELHAQLKRLATERLTPTIPPLADESDPERVHRTILAGFVSHVAHRQDDGTYRLPSGQTAELHPSSAIAKAQARWIVAVEVVETARRWLRDACRIRPEWVEAVAPHMVERSVSEPHWRIETGHVAAWERATMGELTLIPRRRVPFGPIDPAGARQVFIQSALIDGELPGGCPPIKANIALRERLLAQQERERRHDLVAGRDVEFAFYDARLPAELHAWPSFRSWLRDPRHESSVRMTDRDLLADPDRAQEPSAYPDAIDDHGLHVPLQYHHEPGAATDGIEAHVPLAVLGRADPDAYDWLVPGLHDELIEALIRTLPKRIRTRCIPAADVAREAAADLADRSGSLRGRLASWLASYTGLPVQPTDLALDALAPHLRMAFVVRGPKGVIDRARDLRSLQIKHRDAARSAWDEATMQAMGWASWIGRSSRDWPWPALPESIELDLSGHAVIGYPALRATSDGAALFIGIDAGRSAATHAAAVRELVLDALESRLAEQVRHHPSFIDACAAASHRLLEPHVVAEVSRLAILKGVPPDTLPRDRDAFHACVAAIGERAWAFVHEALPLAIAVWRLDQRVTRALDAPSPAAWQRSIDDVRALHARILPLDAARTMDWQAWESIPRRLAALEARLQRIEDRGAARDEANIDRVLGWRDRVMAVDGAGGGSASVEAFRIAELEWELSVFAQDHAAPGHSEQRLERMWADLAGAHAPPRSRAAAASSHEGSGKA